MTGSTVGSKGKLVGGVDGVRGGWVMAVTGVESGPPLCISVWRSFADLWSDALKWGLQAVAVDIPIGLPDTEGRTADSEAREVLKPPTKGKPGRASSVFPAPPLCSLDVDADDVDAYKKAGDLARGSTGKGLTRQAFALFPKIREVREALKPRDFDPGACPRAAEVHPEVSFAVMAERPMSFHKSRQAGVAERLAMLERHFPDIVDVAVRTRRTGPPHPGLDDVFDAVAAAWTARRLIQGTAKRLGGYEKDSCGYPMNIWA